LPILAFSPLDVSGATLRVPSEYATINAALDASAYGDTVLVAPGTYTDYEIRTVYVGGSAPATVTSIAFLQDGVALLSESGPESTVLDLTGAPWIDAAWVVVAGILPGKDTRLEGFTVTGSPTGMSGMRIGACGRVVVDRCHFVDLDARPDESGGGIQVGHSDVEVTRCRFENCHALYGGAIFATDSNLWVSQSEVISCSAAEGAGIVGSSTGPQHNLAFEIRNSRFLANTTALYGEGGAILQSGNGFRASRIVEGCYFEDNRVGGSGGAVYMYDLETSLVVRNNVFVDNGLATDDTSGGGAMLRGTDVWVHNNTFHRCRQDNLFSAGSALVVGGATTLSLQNNVFSENIGAAAVQIRPDVLSLDGGCNIFWDNEGGTMEGAPLDPTDRIVDPLYCDPDAYDLTVSSQSPCLPANSLGCGLIGALGQGCGTVSVIPMSWSRIKGAYR
jgi:hypothetical protein